MQLNQIQKTFNRSLYHCFEKTKVLLTFSVLALCGLLVVFCRGLAETTNSWMTLSLTFLPVFLCSGILLALGVSLIRGYHDEIKKKPLDLINILLFSWETMLGATYFMMPLILLYLMLWMLLGIFILLSSIPFIGNFFAVILAFAPFLINLATLLLSIGVLVILFFITPLIAFKGINRSVISQILNHQLQSDFFSNLVFFIIGLLPLTALFFLLLGAAFLTGSICVVTRDSLSTVLQWFFIMIPFAAILAPALIFFFNFAAEAHVLIHRQSNH